MRKNYWESPSPGAHHKESIRLYQTTPNHQPAYEWLYNHVFQYDIRYHTDANCYYVFFNCYYYYIYILYVLLLDQPNNIYIHYIYTLYIYTLYIYIYNYVSVYIYICVIICIYYMTDCMFIRVWSLRRFRPTATATWSPSPLAREKSAVSLSRTPRGFFGPDLGWIWSKLRDKKPSEMMIPSAGWGPQDS